MIDFISDFIFFHRRLSLGIVLFIAVLIVSNFYSPWVAANGGLAAIYNDPSNSWTDIIMFKLFMFGIYDLLELFYYAMDNPDFSAGGFMFIIAVCSIFCFTKVIQGFLLETELDDFPENVALDLIYDNIFAYVASLILFHCYSPIANSVNQTMSGSGFFAKAFTVILVAALVVIPAIPYLLYIGVYTVSLFFGIQLLDYLEKVITWQIPFFKSAVIFLVSLILILVINLVVSLLLGGIIEAIKNFIVDELPDIVITVLKGAAVIVVGFLTLLLAIYIMSR